MLSVPYSLFPTFPMDGALILDKVEGITSHTAVMQMRRLLKEPRIGHLGTLDPFATGALVLLLGKATRLARFFVDRGKTYEGTMRFGYETDTYDRTGNAMSPDSNPALDAAALRRAFAEFSGPQMQQPPVVSAKKVGGVPSYQLARQGRAIPLDPVPVTIHTLELISVHGPCADFRARVSSGTYIRSLAHDIGKRMGCGAHLARLRRTSVGEFALERAVTFDQLEILVRDGAVPLVPMHDLLPEIPRFVLTPEILNAVSHGNPVDIEQSAKWLRLISGDDGHLAALAESVGDHLYQPRVVMDAG
ncbi:MAG: tRNA pseudouridine(55) synthase TruB [Acidobacteria bacterium]|nr:tRNA pseudouridine(55) synthase TruB [Acidobacteriota bacterium]